MIYNNNSAVLCFYSPIFDKRLLSDDEYFTETFTHRLKCRTFNSADVISKMGVLGSTRAGMMHGLQLGLRVDQQYYGTGADSAGIIVSSYLVTRCRGAPAPPT